MIQQFQLAASAEAGVLKCQPFEAVTGCPRCGEVAAFPTTSVDDVFVSRECGCGMIWKQFK